MRNYKKKSSRFSWDEKSMLEAVNQVINQNLSFENAAVLYNVPVSTLHRKVQKVKKGDDAKQVCIKSK